MATRDPILQVVRVNKGDTVMLNVILDNLIEQSTSKPSTEHLETLLNDNRTYLFAATWDNDVVGYALAYKFPSLYSSDYLAYLYDIEVLEKHRKKGAGRLLIETMREHLKSDGVSELWLGTAVANIAGQALFSATGGMKSGETFIEYIYEL
jgi:aminoglycoside 3-N-acetyltransferase I